MTALYATSDQELISRLKAGDTGAFTAIFDRYQPLLFTQAARVSQDEDLAADLVQEVFVYLWDKRETLLIQGSLLPYLSKAIRYRFFEWLGKNKIRDTYAESYRHFTREAQYSTDELIREKELIQLIDHLVDQLPPKLRTIYRLSRKENLSTREIAAELQLAEKTVQNQLSLALKALKLKLGILQMTGILASGELMAELLKKL